MNKGFSLVELLVSMAILGIVLLPLMRAMDINVVGSQLSGEIRVAANLARREMEKAKNLYDSRGELSDVEFSEKVNNISWEIKREVSGGSPVKIWIKVYKTGAESPSATLFTARETLKWQ